MKKNYFNNFQCVAGSVFHKTRDTGETALHAAAEMGHVEIVRFLIERGADSHATTRSGRSALDLASQKGRAEVVRFLAKIRSESPPSKIPRLG